MLKSFCNYLFKNFNDEQTLMFFCVHWIEMCCQVVKLIFKRIGIRRWVKGGQIAVVLCITTSNCVLQLLNECSTPSVWRSKSPFWCFHIFFVKTRSVSNRYQNLWDRTPWPTKFTGKQRGTLVCHLPPRQPPWVQIQMIPIFLMVCLNDLRCYGK